MLAGTGVRQTVFASSFAQLPRSPCNSLCLKSFSEKQAFEALLHKHNGLYLKGA